MTRAMIGAAVSMNQLQNKLDVIGHNLANSETTGYKSRQSDFQSLLVQQINNVKHPSNANGRLTPEGIRVGSGAKLASVRNDLTMGSIQETDRDLDIALLGENTLFQVQVATNNGTETQYTRDGAFYLSPNTNADTVTLTTKDGHPVLGANGPIELADGFDSIDIRDNGQIVATYGNQEVFAGQLATVEAIRPRLLEEVGDNLFRFPDDADLGYNVNEVLRGTDQGSDIIRSQALETSNVDMSEQLTDMTLAQRSYQYNARTISMGDQMLGLINQLR